MIVATMFHDPGTVTGQRSSGDPEDAGGARHTGLSEPVN
jgi:hypothetical protein